MSGYRGRQRHSCDFRERRPTRATWNGVCRVRRRYIPCCALVISPAVHDFCPSRGAHVSHLFRTYVTEDNCSVRGGVSCSSRAGPLLPTIPSHRRFRGSPCDSCSCCLWKRPARFKMLVSLCTSTSEAYAQIKVGEPTPRRFSSAHLVQVPSSTSTVAGLRSEAWLWGCQVDVGWPVAC